jgi:hypothetical protein
MFRALTHRTLRWRSLSGFGQGDGLCHVEIDGRKGNIVAEGMAIGEIESRSYAARFSSLVCDLQWQTRRLLLETTDSRSLEMISDGLGNWVDGQGNRLPSLGGCIDIDLQASPLTNTLPIRRLRIDRATGAVELSMAYIPFDSFEPYAHTQRYTCLEDDRRYLYESADGSFSAELAVDEDGLVLDYPQLFERVPTN